jgi:hypothetical protein
MDAKTRGEVRRACAALAGDWSSEFNCTQEGLSDTALAAITSVSLAVPALLDALKRCEAERGNLREAFAASEAARKKYREGKFKLYAMGGPVAEAAMSCLPCGEGTLESFYVQTFLEPHRPIIEALEAERDRLRAMFAEAAVRIAKQSDLLSKRAEKPVEEAR